MCEIILAIEETTPIKRIKLGLSLDMKNCESKVEIESSIPANFNFIYK